jgi:hypothetical protein
MKFAYAIVTFDGSRFLQGAIDSIPPDSRIEVINNSKRNWALARNWNWAVDKLLWDEAYDALIIMNDDVVLRPDTGELLAWGILEGQFQQSNKLGTFESHWSEDRPELLLLSARHAHWSDACTDEPDWEMLRAAKPIWQPGPDFSCFCVARKLGQIIGRFDENFNPAYFEDNDTHRRIKLAGYEAGALAPYWHFRSGSLRTDPERQRQVHATFESCKRYYCQKWGAPYDSGHPAGRETYLTPFGK